MTEFEIDMFLHREYKVSISEALDFCDGDITHSRLEYFNLDYLLAECLKVQNKLLAMVPEGFVEQLIEQSTNKK